ncbi:MAG: sigma-70 family RNA polymerase sigma factor [bacterium]|nr:sigma-70 family RNA polymerase sigma factor [bacterium]
MPLKNNRQSQTRRIRNSNDASLDLYLREIGTTPLLTSVQERRLAARIKQGDETALQSLTKANLRFVVTVAKQYQNQGLELGDLINEGNIGLTKAAKRFDETRGFKFISYAVWWIRQAILQALAEQSRIVRIPLNRIGTLHKIGKVSSALEQELGRDPSPDEIAKELKIPEEEISDTMVIANTHLSLDAPFATSEDNSLMDVIENETQESPDTSLLKDSLKLEIEKALSTLAPREARVIQLYFGLEMDRPLTLEEIGNRFNLTRERVRQIKEKAIRRLRHASRSRSLKAYLDQ